MVDVGSFWKSPNYLLKVVEKDSTTTTKSWLVKTADGGEWSIYHHWLKIYYERITEEEYKKESIKRVLKQ